MIIIADKYKITPHANSRCWVVEKMKISRTGKEYWTDKRYPQTLALALEKVRQNLIMEGFDEHGDVVRKVDKYQKIHDDACTKMHDVISVIGEKDDEQITNEQHIKNMLEEYAQYQENYDNHDYYIGEAALKARVKELEEELESLRGKDEQ